MAPISDASHTSFIRSARPGHSRPARGLGYVTMTLHNLSAGTGYEYLTRQVAALDSTEKGTSPGGLLRSEG